MPSLLPLGYVRKRPAIDERLVFMHIPKCGGTSVFRALRNAYLHRGALWRSPVVQVDGQACTRVGAALAAPGGTVDLPVLEPPDVNRLVLMYEASRQATRLIGGHVRYLPELDDLAQARFAWVTVVRDPVDRVLSAYFYGRHKATTDVASHTMTVDEYLAAPQGVQATGVLVEYLSGGRSGRGDDALEQAKRNVDEFAMVGVLEDLEPFVKGFDDRFGVRLRVPVLNRGPVERARQDGTVTDAALERVRELCQADLELYYHVRTRQGRAGVAP